MVVPRSIFEKCPSEAKRLLLLKYSNKWVWDICMEDSRTFAVGIELTKYGHLLKQN